jgi:hypothetical protein
MAALGRALVHVNQLIEGYSMIKFKINDRVAFARDVVQRMGHDRRVADVRGRVVAVSGPGIGGGEIVSVDFEGTWEPHEDGSNVRHVPAANLTKIMTNRTFLWGSHD